MTARPCPEDLLALGRRRPLSDLERQALTAHLGHCDVCRAAELAAELLRASPAERDGELPEGDRAMIERVAERASSALGAGARRARPRGRSVAVAAAALLFVGSAAFAWIGRRPAAPAAPPVAAPMPSIVKGARLRGAPPRKAPADDSPTSLVAPSLAFAAPSVSPRRHAPPRADADAPPLLAPAATASSLFAEANGARRDGDLRRAVSLYESLRNRFPDSDQARLSSISLGDLLVGQGEPARALRAFDAYLGEVRSGPLREEALFGRARCLRTLGDRARERETWATLLRDFPASAYEAVARRRLEELGR